MIVQYEERAETFQGVIGHGNRLAIKIQNETIVYRNIQYVTFFLPFFQFG
jgi:hypothetical protein